MNSEVKDCIEIIDELNYSLFEMNLHESFVFSLLTDGDSILIILNEHTKGIEFNVYDPESSSFSERVKSWYESGTMSYKEAVKHHIKEQMYDFAKLSAKAQDFLFNL